MLLKTNSLTPEAYEVIVKKGTERPFSGHYSDWNQPGSYLCRQCGLVLFRSQAKFHSGCGWPSFDEDLPKTVLQEVDADGRRTEILCQRCRGHLGHVFQGEGYTAKNLRHCVNSLSLDFVPDLEVTDTEEAIFAAGCFWGVEYYFQKLPGVLKTEVGYIGGKLDYPRYEKVCNGDTGHVEALRVLYDPEKISYEELVKYFFEIHDPTQDNGQGPDLGEQYLSRIYYHDESQKKTAEKLMQILRDKHLNLATQVLPSAPFWHAEDYHQAYYQKNGKQPYCHHYVKRF